MGIYNRVRQLGPALGAPLVRVWAPKRTVAVRGEDADHDGGALRHVHLVHHGTVAPAQWRREWEYSVFGGATQKRMSMTPWQQDRESRRD